MVLCGDTLIDLDLTATVKQHKEKGGIATIVTKSVSKEVVSSYGVVVSDEEGRIQTFQEKPSIEEAISTEINTEFIFLNLKLLIIFLLIKSMILGVNCSPN